MDISRLRQKSIDRGEPPTILEMVGRFPEIKRDDNAAEALVDLWAAEEGNHWNNWRATGKLGAGYRGNNTAFDPDLPVLGTTKNGRLPWPEAELKAARAFASSRVERNKQMKAALSRPQARFPIAYQDGFNTLLPHLASLKREVGGFQVENLLAVQEGRVADSIGALDQMARLTNTLREEPFLISQLVRNALAAITLKGVTELASWQPLDSQQLDQLTAIVNELEVGDGFHRAMSAERAGAMAVFGMDAGVLQTLGSNTPGGGNPAAGIALGVMKFSGLMSADQRLLMSAFDQLMPVVVHFTPSGQEQVGRIMDDTISQAGMFPPKIYTRLLLPALEKTGGKFLNIEAERRLTLAMLAVKRYQLEHDGRLPVNMSEINLPDSAGEFLDPFDGKTIVIEPTDEGFLLRTVATGRLTDAVLPVGGRDDFSLGFTNHVRGATGAGGGTGRIP